MRRSCYIGRDVGCGVGAVSSVLGISVAASVAVCSRESVFFHFLSAHFFKTALVIVLAAAKEVLECS